jgi:hypothetical protein
VVKSGSSRHLHTVGIDWSGALNRRVCLKPRGVRTVLLGIGHELQVAIGSGASGDGDAGCDERRQVFGANQDASTDANGTQFATLDQVVCAAR